jgi:outer membrane protein OmpA-like peptidoglycan-associated protein
MTKVREMDRTFDGGIMKKLVVAVPVLALALGGTTACATKKFVRGEVGEVNNKVETISKSLEETQERTKANEAKITEVDQRAQQAASAADNKATAAGQRADAAKTSADAANTKAEAVEKASKRLIYEVTLSEDKGNFKFGKAALPEQAQTELDQLVEKLKAEPNGAYIEIEGHTDNVGDKVYNEKLGEERAEQVKRYLYEAHQIPLHKINVISYGEDKPVSPNKTKAGRAQNRRVVIRVLA